MVKAKEAAQGKTLLCPGCKSKLLVPVKALRIAKVAAPGSEPPPSATPAVAAVPLADSTAGTLPKKFGGFKRHLLVFMGALLVIVLLIVLSGFLSRLYIHRVSATRQLKVMLRFP